MFTNLETRVFDIIFSVTSSKLSMFPLSWKNNRVSVKLNSKRVCNALILVIVLAKLIVCINDLRTLQDKRKHIISVILLTISTLKFIIHIVLRISFWIFRLELARLVNETLNIISTWGKLNTKLIR